MDVKKILLAALGGGIVCFLLGGFFYGFILGDFFEANSGSATGVMKSDEEIELLPLLLGNIIYALLYVIIFDRWAGIKTFTTGLKAGALIGGLFGLSYNLINMGVTNMGTWPAASADVVVTLVMGSITGGVIGWILGRMDKS